MPPKYGGPQKCEADKLKEAVPHGARSLYLQLVRGTPARSWDDVQSEG